MIVGAEYFREANRPIYAMVKVPVAHSAKKRAPSTVQNSTKLPTASTPPCNTATALPATPNATDPVTIPNARKHRIGNPVNTAVE